MIIDAHAHLASRQSLPDPFFDGWIATLKRSLPGELSGAQEQRLSELFSQMREDADCSRLVEEMDLAGIDRSVLMLVDFGLAFEGLGWDIEAVHLRHRELMESSPRLLAFSGVDPRRGRWGLHLFEKAVRDWGFCGFKVYPPCGFSPSDSALFPFYEICASLQLPVLVHLGPSSSSMAFRYSQPMELDRAAQLFPKLNFILGHAGSLMLPEALLMAQYRPNIYLDLSGFQQPGSGMGLEAMMRQHLARRLERRLLFGTDWPIHRFYGSQAHWVQALRGLEASGLLSRAQLDGVLGGNAERLLSARLRPAAERA